MSLEGATKAMALLRGKINSLGTLVMNAYDIAVKNGFEGTEAEWLSSLEGAPGQDVTEEQMNATVVGYMVARFSALEELLKLVVYKEDPAEAFAAFQEAFKPVIPATAISLSSMIKTFSSPGTTSQLTATVTPENSTDEVVWESSDESVATVENGLITTTGYGDCTITATAGFVSATCSVSVASIRP